ncbi:RluA family pseudouridine synthase [Metabacillus rhizolycopersici]|uniref:Pseudouridine synthase n=1 Tax=Metabacillus rhizolycopersici TaxID=2875709 RepID=A0ABS7UKX9_9BACI|nr:RluA family pseudouridine synthase [Metabacillus rhizolycopersici]MBZ5748980.1 RluA family pseudouridine synthase [Metabacillus rhizolycopersici]
MQRFGEWLEIKIPKEWAQNTVFHVLSKELGASKSLIQKWNSSSAIKRNNSKADVNHQLQTGDRLFLHIFGDEDYGVLPEYQTIDVLYEDDHLLIVNKRAGIDTHPNEAHQKGTLANGIAYYYQSNGLQIRVRHIHRLDKDTSGAIIFAKHDLAHSLLNHALELRKIKRTYIAIIEGKLPHPKGKIDQPIGRDRHHATRRRVSPQGQRAITHYQVEQYVATNHISIVSLQLDTGRTHQIRVHLSSIGHPIIGDVLYGGKKGFIGRQALHALKVALIHPFTAEKIEVEADFPTDMLSLLPKN